MKLLLRLLAVGSLLAASISSAADAFEGKVSLAMSAGKNKTQTLNYSIRQDAMRIDMTAEGGKTFAMIMDLKKLEMTMLMEEQKTYMVMPMKQTIENRHLEDEQTLNSTIGVELEGIRARIAELEAKKLAVSDEGGGSESAVEVGR